MEKYISFLVMFCFACLAGCNPSIVKQSLKTQAVIVRHGQAEAVIVLPENAPEPVRFAARELKYYIDKIAGCDIQITSKIPENRTAIILGEEFAESVAVDVDKIKRDGYAIKTIGNHIYIAGKDDNSEKSKILLTVKNGPLPENATGVDRHLAFGDVAWGFERGTLHGAYDFLERLGVRWFFPGPKGEVVPNRSDLSIKPVNIIEEPFFDIRLNSRIIFPLKRYLDMGLFDINEYNELGWNGRNQRLWMVRQRLSSRFMAFNHRPRKHQWSERFGKTNPEFFVLKKDGTRATGGHLEEYLNYTSEGMLKETFADIDAFFSGKSPASRGIYVNPKYPSNKGWHAGASYKDTFSLLPNDGLQVDCSEKSRKYIHEDMPFPHRHSDYIWQFVDKVARETIKKYPDKKLVCLAYQTYWEVPRCLDKLPDNVIVGVAALSGCGRISNSVNKKSYKQYLDLLERWSKMNNQPMLFWVYNIYRLHQPSRKGIPMILPRHAGKYFKDMARYGKYVFMENEDFDNIIMDHINRYVYSRLMWNSNADVDAIINDYVESYYGPAAEAMKKLFGDIESRCMKIAADNADTVAVWEAHFTGEVLNRYKELISQAKEITKGTVSETRVDLICKRFIGEMAKTREKYVTDFKKLKDQGKDIIKVRKASPDSITIDGQLLEKEWVRTGGRLLFNNANGRVTRQHTRVRFRFTPDKFYCFFDIISAGAGEHLKGPGKKDYIEVFLDVNNDKDTYYWIMVDMTGKETNYFFPGAGEPPISWESKAEIAVKVDEADWKIEMVIPLKSMNTKLKVNGNQTWGGNFCVTRFKERGTSDIFSSTNPIMRGPFHNPGRFATLVFVGEK